MSKQIAKIPLKEISKIQIYVNSKRKSVSTIKKETGARYVLNGGFFNSNWTACPFLKGDGVIYAGADYSQWGFGWNEPTDITMYLSPNNTKNFISCIDLINPWDGKNANLKYDKVAIGGSRGRSVIATTNDCFVMYCSGDGTSDAKTPEGVRDELVGLGCNLALMLDGGGSSQCDFDGSKITSSRIVHNFILVYTKADVVPPTTDYRKKVVEIAASQLGVSAPTGDDKYIDWYNSQFSKPVFSRSDAWCAMFVSWCMRQAGVPTSVVPNYASCRYGVADFKKMGIWRPHGTYTPKTGDIIIFDWQGDNWEDHTGLVEKVDSRYVYTIEGNSGTPGAVRRKTYALTSASIFGYAEWGNSTTTNNTSIKLCQEKMNSVFGSKLTTDGSFGPASKTALIKAIQKTIGVTQDGSFGPATRSKFPTVTSVTAGNIALCCQIALIVNGYTSLSLDSSFGPSCKSATTQFEKYAGLSQNGTLDSNVMLALLNRMKGDTTSNVPEEPETPTTPTEPEQPTDTPIVKCQKFMNGHFNSGVATDGSFGPASKKALIKAVQKTIGVSQDGSFGPASKSVFPDVKAVTKGDIAYCVQIGLISKGYNIELDGSYGTASANAIKDFQKKKSIKQDGICGGTTFSYLVK